MRGRIVFINPATNTGLIFGADRVRYSFAMGEWRESGAPARNLEVMFDVKGETALRVRPFTFDGDMPELYDTDDAIAKAEAMLDDGGDGMVKGRVAPTIEPRAKAKVKPAASELPGGEEIEIPLTGGTKAGGVLDRGIIPGQKPAAPLGKTVLIDDAEGKPPRPAWQYYVAGILAALVFILVAYLTRHLFFPAPH